MNVAYEWSEVQTWILHHHVCHELRNGLYTGPGLLGKLFPVLSFFTTNKVEIHEETLVANNYFDFMWTNNHNLQFFLPTAIKQRFLSSSYLSKYDDTQILTAGPFHHWEKGG